MEIPLVLRERSNGRLVYAIPAAYRAAMALGFGAVAAALALDSRGPGLGGWVVLAILALAGLYEERWTFDPGAGAIVRRVGILLLARKKSFALGDVAGIRLAPLVRGAAPGSEEEGAAERAALAGVRPDYSPRRGRSRATAYLRLVLELRDGSRQLVYISGPWGSRSLREAAGRISRLLGLPLAEGRPGSGRA